MKFGVYCLHCEHVTLDDDIATNEYGDRFCSVCDAGDWDLWPVRGPDLATGTSMSYDALAEARYYPDEEE